MIQFVAEALLWRKFVVFVLTDGAHVVFVLTHV